MDTKDILAILEKFNQTALAEFKFKEGSVEFSLKRHSETLVVNSAALPQAAPAAVPAAIPVGNIDKSVSAASGSNTEIISSPIVGTIYRMPAPDAPPFVEEGKLVKKGQTICIIEAMKVMNELEAEFDCEIVKVLTDNQQFVEYGTPLFEVIRK